MRDAVGRHPARTAVASGDRTWTYAKLWSLASGTAAALAAAGIVRGDVVAIHSAKGVEAVSGLLAVLGMGAVALPIDASLPARRKRAMLDESGARLVMEATDDPRDWHDDLPRLDLREAQRAAAPDPAAWPVVAAPEAPAYVFFTSGTTGRPKAILGSQKGLAHFIAWELAELAVCEDDRVAQVTSLSFDAMLRDVFVPLAAGAMVCLPGCAATEDPGRMLGWLDSAGVTVVHTAPSVLATWAAAPRAGVELRRLRAVCLSGEPLTGALVDRWRRAFPRAGAAVLNLYGPSETTMIKSCYRVPESPPAGALPIGRPLPDTQLLVLRDGERHCAVGEQGEIAIRTPFRTLGYLNAPHEQAARFVANPFTGDPADLLYLTGDRGRYEPDGSVSLGGRLDDELKVHGVRVQPAEVAALLGEHPRVQRCAVVPAHAPGQEPALAAFYVPSEDGDAGPAAIRAHLAERLPAALVPARIVAVHEIPLNPNGKVNRAALVEAARRAATAVRPHAAPRSETERAIAAIWSGLLDLEAVGREDSFFDLGGHSLLAMSMVAEIRHATGVQVPLRCVFQTQGLAGLAREVDRLRSGVDGE